MAKMRTYLLRTISNSAGETIPGATVAIYKLPEDTLADFYLLEDAVTLKDNPSTSDINGQVYGWLEIGHYRLEIVTESGTATQMYYSNHPDQSHLYGTASADDSFSIQNQDDDFARFAVDSNGTVTLGSGTAAPDVTIYRSGDFEVTLETDVIAQSLSQAGSAANSDGLDYVIRYNVEEEIESAIGTVTTDITEGFGSVDARFIVDEDLIAANGTAISELESDVTALSGTVTGHTSDIEDLQNRINSVEESTTDISYEWTNTATPGTGELGMVPQTNSYGSVTQFILGTSDLNGFTPAVSLVQIGDVVKIKDNSGTVSTNAIYEVTGVGTANDIDVDFLAGTDTGPDYGDVVTLIHVPTTDISNLATTTYVDTQDDLRLSKTGGSVTGEVEFVRPGNDQSGNLIIKGWDGTGSADILTVFHNSGTVPDAINYTGRTNSGNNIQNKNSVQTLIDSSVSSYLPLAGGTVTGATSFTNNVTTTKTLTNTAGTAILNKIESEVITFNNTAPKINAYFGTANLSNRAGLLINVPGDGPFSIASSSSYKPAMKVFAYDGGSPDTRMHTLTINARGEIVQESGYTTKINSTDKHFLTKSVIQEMIDEAVANVSSGSTFPIGSIVGWLVTSAPSGWAKLQGGRLSKSSYPDFASWVTSKSPVGFSVDAYYIYLPDWSGRYLGEYGGHLTNPLGTKKAYTTARPSGTSFTTNNTGAHTHTYGNSGGYGGGTTKSAYDARNSSNSYTTSSSGSHSHTITGGGDSQTRPDTVVVHWIIKIN
jgi:hypothetical protein